MIKPTCWVITDGKQGMEIQCLGLAERLGLDPVVKRVQLRFPWRQLSPFPLMIGNRYSLSGRGDQLDGPLPDIVISTGRRSVSSSLAIKERSAGRAFRIQIQDPGISPRHFDLVVVPRHDRLRGDNVVLSSGGLHSITTASLESVRQAMAGRFADLPRPLIAVLIGGSNGVYRLTPDILDKLGNQLTRLVQDSGGALLVTPSRRTGRVNKIVLRGKLEGLPGEVWSGEGENPYLAYLAFADAILVTADSVNMVTEAAATGKPVYVLPLDGGSTKFRRFHQAMEQSGYTRPFKGVLEQWSYPPLDDTGEIAELVREKLAERGVRW